MALFGGVVDSCLSQDVLVRGVAAYCLEHLHHFKGSIRVFNQGAVKHRRLLKGVIHDLLGIDLEPHELIHYCLDAPSLDSLNNTLHLLICGNIPQLGELPNHFIIRYLLLLLDLRHWSHGLGLLLAHVIHWRLTHLMNLAHVLLRRLVLLLWIVYLGLRRHLLLMLLGHLMHLVLRVLIHWNRIRHLLRAQLRQLL